LFYLVDYPIEINDKPTAIVEPIIIENADDEDDHHNHDDDDVDDDMMMMMMSDVDDDYYNANENNNNNDDDDDDDDDYMNNISNDQCPNADDRYDQRSYSRLLLFFLLSTLGIFTSQGTLK